MTEETAASLGAGGQALPELPSIDAVEARRAYVPLRRPFRLGGRLIEGRAYAIVRVRTAGGTVGEACALTRDLPVVERLLGGALGEDRAGRRAASILDVATWDAAGKEGRRPVWQLLGGRDAPVACMAVAGYPVDEPERVAEAVVEQAQAGHALVKIARMPSPSETARVLRAAARALPSHAKLVVDAAWFWKDAAEAVAELRTWAGLAPLAWVEDPLDPADVDGYAALVQSGIAPIGVGDDLTDPSTSADLVRRARVSVLRVDALAIGGIGAALGAASIARAEGVDVSFHVAPGVHAHLASVVGGTVETFVPAIADLDPVDELYSGAPPVHRGQMPLTLSEGLGMRLTGC